VNYYFLAASLPTLSLDAPPPFSCQRFRALCAEHMSAKDLQTLDSLAEPLTTPSENSFVQEWRRREIHLRNAIARTRALRLQIEAAPYLREAPGYEAAIEHAVSEAYSRTSPLERELAIDRFRWRQLDELAGLNPFSLHALLAYALKLTLVERWASMTEKMGTARANEVVQSQPQAQLEPA